MSRPGRRGRALFLAAGLALLAPARVARPDEPPVPETPRALPVDEGLLRTLASPRYRFCLDQKYPLLPDEVAWCPLLPRSPDPHATRCQSLRAACALGATAGVFKPKPLEWRLPSFGGLGAFLFYGLLAVAAVGLVVLLVRGALSLPARRRGSGDAPSTLPRPPPNAQAVNEEVERDVDRLLQRAHAAAAAGDFAAAVADLHAALFRRLEGDGHVRIHASATNGDYLREIRTRAPGLAGPVGEVVRDVESVEFGLSSPTGESFRRLLGRVQPLLGGSLRRSPDGMRAGALGTVVALGLALGLGTSCGASFRLDWPSSPSGSAAVLEFLTAVGIEARERLAPLGELNAGGSRPPPAQLVLLPGAEVGEREWAALRDWLTDDHNTLILATGARPLPAWLDNVEMVSSGSAGPLRATKALAGADSSLLRGRVPGGGWVRTSLGAANALLTRGKPYALLVPSEAGRVIAVADDRLFVNASLVVDDNGALLKAIMSYGGGAVELVGEDTGLVAQTPLASVSRGRLAPFLMQLCGCLILFLLLRGRAFGRLVDPEVVRRRVFGEHVQALGMQYARARAAGHALHSYAAWAVERLRERIRLSGDRGMGDLASAIAARTGRPLGDVARVLYAVHRDPQAAVAAASDEDRSRAGVRQSLQTMRDLAALVAETAGAPFGRSLGRAKLPPRTTGSGGRRLSGAFPTTSKGDDRERRRAT